MGPGHRKRLKWSETTTAAVNLQHRNETYQRKETIKSDDGKEESRPIKSAYRSSNKVCPRESNRLQENSSPISVSTHSYTIQNLPNQKFISPMHQTSFRTITNTNFANWPESHNRLFFLGMWNTHIGTCVFIKCLKIFSSSTWLFSLLRLLNFVKCLE